MTQKKSCGGDCCKRFVLPYSPKELEEYYRAWVIGGGYKGSHPIPQKRGTTPEGDGKFGLSRSYYEDHIAVDPEIYLLFPMLIYLGYENFEPCRPRKRLDIRMHHYTCKHFDKKAGLCTIYEHRPLMCRRFPNGDACPYPNCKLPGNKKKLQEQKREAKKYAVRKLEELTVEEG